MGIIARMIQPGVMLTLHAGLPSGSLALARSGRLPGSTFTDIGRLARNVRRIDCTGTANGNARYVGVWIEGVLEGTGELTTRQDITPGLTLYFPRGGLELRR